MADDFRYRNFYFPNPIKQIPVLLYCMQQFQSYIEIINNDRKLKNMPVLFE